MSASEEVAGQESEAPAMESASGDTPVDAVAPTEAVEDKACPPSCFGIDLGSTRNLVASLQAASSFPTVLRNQLASPAHPCVVAFSSSVYKDQRFIGDVAKSQQASNPVGSITYVKQLLGTAESQCSPDAEEPHVTHSITAAPSATQWPLVDVAYDQRDKLNVHTLLSVLLRKLHQTMSAAHDPIPQPCHTVFAVPACFGPSQVQAIVDSATLAHDHLTPTDVIPDIVAALLCYCVKHASFVGTLMIVDMGDAFSSAIVARVTEGQSVQVLATACSPHCGVRDFVQLVVQRMTAQFTAKTGVDVSSLTGRAKAKAKYKLLQAASKAVNVLSGLKQTQVMVEMLAHDRDLAPLSLTQAWLASEAEPGVLARFTQTLQRAMQDASIGPECGLDVVAVIGGGTRIPCVRDAVQRVTGCDAVSQTMDSEASVALGAALWAANRGGWSVEGAPTLRNGSAAESCPLSADAAAQERALLHQMDERDAAIRAVGQAKNELESYVFAMLDRVRSSNDDTELAACLPEQTVRDDLIRVLQEADRFCSETDAAEQVEVFTDKLAEVKAKVSESAPLLVAELQRRSEVRAKELADAAAQGPVELGRSRAKERLLRPRDKIDAALERKEQGTKHFRNLAFAEAAKRYTQGLELLLTLADLTPELEEESHAVSLALYLNLVLVYLRMKQPKRALDNAERAVKLAPTSSKALFRQAQALQVLGEWEKARDTLNGAVALSPGDKTLAKELVKVERRIALAKKKEKAMYSRMFG